MTLPTSTGPARPAQVLDPRLLGRPVHLLPQFARRLGDALGAAMQAQRRYWGGCRIESVEFGRAPDDALLRWLGVAGPQGALSAAFERSLMLGLLDWRYGPRGAAAPARDPAAERVTATEQRLAAVLAQQLAEVLFACVGAGQGAPAQAAPAGAPATAAWAIRVVLRLPQADRLGQCWIALDNELMGQILQALQPERSRAARGAAEPLGSALQVRLDGRLVSKEITLAALFGLKVGDVIPVSVGRAEVLLDESRLFTAAVAEHKGKLCLTSFEDAE